MFVRRSGLRVWSVFAAFVLAMGLGAPSARAQFGLAVSGVGPINRSMGGASTAAPLDAAGAIYWNPATMGDLGHSEMEFGAGFIVPRTTIASRISANALGPGVPPISVSGGNTGANNGVFVLPAFGLVYSPEESPVTYGLGVFSIGGFGVNYPISARNPILNPQPPFGLGVGPLYTQLQLLQFSPAISLKLSDAFSIGAAANIDMGTLSANPGLFGTPTFVTSPLGLSPNFPSALQGRSRAGGGAQIGLYYNPGSNWSFGASVKSPQWFQAYTYNSETAQGHPARPRFELDFPLTASVGLAYKGIDRLLIASDFRFLDYRYTNGFRGGGFDPRTGMLRGLGWQNVFAAAVGAQYMMTDALALRTGYTFSLNPVGPSQATINLGSPTIIQHSIAAGASYDVNKHLKLSVTYAHDFQSSVTGPITLPFLGPVHGSVRTASTADLVFAGASVAF